MKWLEWVMDGTIGLIFQIVAIIFIVLLFCDALNSAFETFVMGKYSPPTMSTMIEHLNSEEKK